MNTVYLRALDRDDLERTHAWHNDPALYESLGGTFRFVSKTAEEEWLRSAAAFSQQQVNLAICLADNGEHIGNAYLRNIDWVARHGEVHMLIGESVQRAKGHGQSALRQLMAHATQDLGLLRLYLYALEDNHAAQAVYTKCGFVVEGRLRRHAFKAGRYKDVVVMGYCVGAE